MHHPFPLSNPQPLFPGNENIIQLGPNEITFSSSITEINSKLFKAKSDIKILHIPPNIKSIDPKILSDCHDLLSISVDQNNPSFCIDDGILFSKDKTTIIYFPKYHNNTHYHIPSSVKSIGYKAFNKCNNLTSLTIPSSVTSIAESVFVDLPSLREISVESSNFAFVSVGNNLFTKNMEVLIRFVDCESTSEYVIPNTVKKIGNYAFYYSRLTKITIPSSVTSIGEMAFSFCKLKFHPVSNTLVNVHFQTVMNWRLVNCKQISRHLNLLYFINVFIWKT